MLRTSITILLSVGLPGLLLAQSSQPPVKVNVLNVCTPSAEEKQELAAALAKIPRQPLFGADFEVDRGRSTLDQTPDFLQAGQGAQVSSEPSVANWVRIRREFGVQAMFSTVQYSFSLDARNMSETLTFRAREAKDILQVTIEDAASAVTSPAVMLGASTPASRIRLERFGKSSVVLARCSGAEGGPAPDQSAYEPLFQSATGIVSHYRALLDARRTVPDELARVTASAGGRKPSSKPAASHANSQKKKD
ncbi:MAG TPA: hypothetical protein VGF06_02105 [Terriglobales bacterium]